MADFEGLIITAIRFAISPGFYSSHKTELDKLAFEIGVEQQEHKPKKENA